MISTGSTSRLDTKGNTLSPEEAQAVVGLWSLQQRLGAQLAAKPTIEDVAEGLSISPEEVRAYLDRVRAATPIAPKRTKKQDIRLAIFVFVLMAIVVYGAIGFYSMQRMRYRVYTPTPSIPVASYDAGGGFHATSYQYFSRTNFFPSLSLNPNRFVFAVGSTVFESTSPAGIKANLDDVSSAIRTVVGGSLADNSRIASRRIEQAEIEQALERGSRGASRQLVEWKTVRVAFGGKEIQAEFPFALVSQKEVREAVEAKQSSLIAELAAGAIELSKNRGAAVTMREASPPPPR